MIINNLACKRIFLVTIVLFLIISSLSVVSARTQGTIDSKCGACGNYYSIIGLVCRYPGSSDYYACSASDGNWKLASSNKYVVFSAGARRFDLFSDGSLWYACRGGASDFSYNIKVNNVLVSNRAVIVDSQNHGLSADTHELLCYSNGDAGGWGSLAECSTCFCAGIGCLCAGRNERKTDGSYVVLNDYNYNKNTGWKAGGIVVSTEGTPGDAGSTARLTEGAQKKIHYICTTPDDESVHSWIIEKQCGDGVRDFWETCDGGNTANGDGCNENCGAEYCGDGILTQSNTAGSYLFDNPYDVVGILSIVFPPTGSQEECDNGTLTGNPERSTCTINCKNNKCGDGWKCTFAREQCDDGNTVSGDGCNASCKNEFCGDNVLQPALGEECDGGSGCKSNCIVKRCGNGFIDANEVCDVGTPFNSGIHGSVAMNAAGEVGKSFSFSSGYLDNLRCFGKEDNATIALWFKTSASGSLLNISFIKSSSDYFILQPSIKPDGSLNTILANIKINGANYNIQTDSISGTFNDGSWHFYALTWKGGSMPKISIYIDGSLRVSDKNPAIPMPFNWSSDYCIGKIGQGFNGNIDEFAVFNKALDVSQLNSIYSLSKSGSNLNYCTEPYTGYCLNLSQYLKFEETSGTTAGDSSYNNGVICNPIGGSCTYCNNSCALATNTNHPECVRPDGTTDPACCDNLNQDDYEDAIFNDGISKPCGTAGVCANTQKCIEDNTGQWGSCLSEGIDAGLCASCNSSGNRAYNASQSNECSPTGCSSNNGCGTAPVKCGAHVKALWSSIPNTCAAIDSCTSNSCMDSAGASYISCLNNLDSDGWSADCGDCNDGNAAVNPAATEVCDGIDNDCDGTVDESHNGNDVNSICYTEGKAGLYKCIVNSTGNYFFCEVIGTGALSPIKPFNLVSYLKFESLDLYDVANETAIIKYPATNLPCADYAASSGLVAYTRLDNTMDQNISGGPTISYPSVYISGGWVPGKVEGAYNINNSIKSYFSWSGGTGLGNLSKLVSNNQYGATAEFWIYRTEGDNFADYLATNCGGFKLFICGGQTGLESSNPTCGGPCNASTQNYLFGKVYNGTTWFTVKSDGPISKNAWHHIVYTFDNTKHSLWIDGAEKTTNYGQTISISEGGTKVNIGYSGATSATSSCNYNSCFNAADAFSGYLDETALYNRPLTASEIQQHYNKGLAGMHVCGAQAGEPIKPALSNVSKVGNYSFYFDGSSKWMGVDSSVRDASGLAYYNLKNNGSIEAWINLDASGSGDRVIAALQDSSMSWAEYMLYVNSSNYLVGMANQNLDSPQKTTSTSALSAGWHHVAYTFNQNSQNVYIDGVLAGSTNYNTGSYTLVNKPYVIGYDNIANSKYFKGKIDEFVIYREKLSSDKIAVDYIKGYNRVGIFAPKCPDKDLDGWGIGTLDMISGCTNCMVDPGKVGTAPACNARQDCNDGSSDINPGKYDSSANDIDNDCNLIYDDAAPDNDIDNILECYYNSSGAYLGENSPYKIFVCGANNHDQDDDGNASCGIASSCRWGDGFLDTGDNCPFIFNPGQENYDRDIPGDVCDTDADSDNILNTADNCQLYYNPSQENADADSLGDKCDIDAQSANTSFICAAGMEGEWIYKSHIQASDVYWTAPAVFNADGNWHMIVGEWSNISGYTWNSSASGWQSNNNLTRYLYIPTIYYSYKPTAFYRDNKWHLMYIYGETSRSMRVYDWNGSTFTPMNNTFAACYGSGYSCLQCSAIADSNSPEVFQKDGELYLILGMNDGTFAGYKWSRGAYYLEAPSYLVTCWAPSNIANGLGDIGGQSAPSVFQDKGILYLISGEYGYGDQAKAFKWNGTLWQVYNDMNVSAMLGDSRVIPEVFYKDGKWQLVYGDTSGDTRFYDFEKTGVAPTNVDPIVLENIAKTAKVAIPAGAVQNCIDDQTVTVMINATESDVEEFKIGNATTAAQFTYDFLPSELRFGGIRYSDDFESYDIGSVPTGWAASSWPSDDRGVTDGGNPGKCIYVGGSGWPFLYYTFNRLKENGYIQFDFKYNLPVTTAYNIRFNNNDYLLFNYRGIIFWYHNDVEYRVTSDIPFGGGGFYTMKIIRVNSTHVNINIDGNDMGAFPSDDITQFYMVAMLAYPYLKVDNLYIYDPIVPGINSNATIELSYDAVAVDETDLNLDIYKYNEITEAWEPQGATKDIANDKLMLSTIHF